MHDLLASSFSLVSRLWESATWLYRHGRESHVVYPVDVRFMDENRVVPWWKGPEVAGKVDEFDISNRPSENRTDQPLPEKISSRWISRRSNRDLISTACENLFYIRKVGAKGS